MDRWRHAAFHPHCEGRREDMQMNAASKTVVQVGVQNCTA
jgi:hypothetical protein